MKHTRRTKLIPRYTGNRPTDPAAKLLAHTDGWLLYERTAHTTEVWRSLKLISTTPRAKANYWLGWNRKEFRFAHTPDIRHLQDHLPEVAAWVETEVTQGQLL